RRDFPDGLLDLPFAYGINVSVVHDASRLAGGYRMYPLPIVLLGIDEELMPILRRELCNGSAEHESGFRSANMAIDCLRHYKHHPRLLIVRTGADLQPETISRLAATLKGWPILALVPGDGGKDFLRINRAGAVQVLALPLEASDLQQALGVIG